MKERPILFSGPMVRAIIEDRKTVTRRVCKMQPEPPRALSVPLGAVRLDTQDGPRWRVRWSTPGVGEELGSEWLTCPFDVPRLWVKETWGAPHGLDSYRPSEMPTDTRVNYAATAGLGGPLGLGGLIGRPSIFMPRWASRLTLDVVSVRVERLEEINDADALLEGVESRDAFMALWESINGDRPGCSWEANPWVWRVEFRRVEVAK